MEEENGRQNVIYSELFQKQWPKKTASTSCRYLLKQIKDHTYIINGKTVLEDVEERHFANYEKPLSLRLWFSC